MDIPVLVHIYAFIERTFLYIIGFILISIFFSLFQNRGKSTQKDTKQTKTANSKNDKI